MTNQEQKKQKKLTRITKASKLVAFSIAEGRTMHSTELMRVIDCVVSKTNLCEENQAVIACCCKDSILQASEIVEIRLKIITEKLSAGFYNLDYVNSGMNVAEMFTKAEHKLEIPGS
ncbi:hypothetical protein OXX80_004521 [Metschnikowia pulcherrima]